ncbi:MAG: carbohydrate ABC transporter permease [Caldicoprobacterales bacterium]|jgi:raffinose/stachyose/melibiose transport system permease protein|nr:carbohydrate ABC transporter permease [Clostridiales bacterium]
MKTKKPLAAIVYYLVMIIISAYCFFPMIWMVYSSFKTNLSIFKYPLALPESVSFTNWKEAWRIGKISVYAGNSLFITATTTAALLLFSAMAAYAFSRISFKGKGVLVSLFVLGLFLPIQSYFIAQNAIINFLHLGDSFFCLILPYIAMGVSLAIYILREYFSAIPTEMDESARIDGAGHAQIFWAVMLPMVTPGLATAGVFTTLSVWNEFLLALLYIQNPDMKTLTVGMYAFSGQHSTDYAMLFAGLSMITIPMILVYFMFNKVIVSGIIEGAVKG